MNLEEISLSKGSHETPESGMCAMEAVAYIAGEEHTDHPQCVCPVIAALMRAWNDALPDDLRQSLIKPLLPLVMNSRVGGEAQDRRAILVADWTQRTVLPIWMDAAKIDATPLRMLPEAFSICSLNEESRSNIVSDAKMRCAAARDAAGDAAGDAARDAAWDAAGAAARDAAGAAAGAAAWNAARDAARDAAWNAARDAAWNAAWAAAGDAARDAARDALQESKLKIWNTYPALITRLLEEK